MTAAESLGGTAGGRAERTGRVAASVTVSVLLLGFFSALALSTYHGAGSPELFVPPDWSAEELRAVLADFGVPVVGFVGYWILLEVVVDAAGMVAAYFILRGAVTGFRLSLVTALLLHATAAGLLPAVIGRVYPQLAVATDLIYQLAWFVLYPLMYVFPDGRFVPRWSRWLVGVWAAFIVVSVLQPGQLIDERILIGALLVLLCTCGAAQVYRYRHVSDDDVRHRTRWVTRTLLLRVGITVALMTPQLGRIVNETSSRGLLIYALTSLASAASSAAVIIAIAVAILRFRLFDIDVWISRALVYVILTACVVGAYVAVVGGLGVLWRGGDTVLPLIAVGLIAAMFSPAREWIQRRVNRLVYGDRDDPDGALTRLGRQLAGVVLAEAVAPTVVDAVARAMKVPYAALFLGTPEVVVAVAGRRAVDTESFPLEFRGEPLGRLVVGYRTPGDGFSPIDRRVLADLAGHCGAALYAAQESVRTAALAVELQQAREQLVSAREEERRRLRRDLHDSLGPALGSQALTIDAARSRMATDPEAADALLRDLKAQSQDTLAEVRRLAQQLRPPALDDLGLAIALEHIHETYGRAGLTIHVHVEPLPDLPAAWEVAVYRIAHEALTNVVRHADAGTCDLSLMVLSHRLDLEVVDDGRGIAADAPTGIGMTSMRERAEELGGSLRVTSVSGGGTRIAARLPLPTGKG